MVARDLLFPVIWAAGWFGKATEWRGKRVEFPAKGRAHTSGQLSAADTEPRAQTMSHDPRAKQDIGLPRERADVSSQESSSGTGG